jgi:hypothetical protein
VYWPHIAFIVFCKDQGKQCIRVQAKAAAAALKISHLGIAQDVGAIPWEGHFAVMLAIKVMIGTTWSAIIDKKGKN